MKKPDAPHHSGAYPLFLCFVDESGNSETFVMGCALSSERKWMRLDKEWKRALAEYRIPYFHMRELVARRGPFAGWLDYKADSLIKKLVWILTTYIIMWNGAIVSVRDYNAIVETDKRKKRRNPYFHAFQTCLSGTMIYCQQKSILGKIGFVFDSGSMSKLHAHGYFETFKLLEEMPNREQIGALLLKTTRLTTHYRLPTFLLTSCTNMPAGFNGGRLGFSFASDSEQLLPKHVPTCQSICQDKADSGLGFPAPDGYRTTSVRELAGAVLCC